MILPFKDKDGDKFLWQDWLGLHVFYQRPGMPSPEYAIHAMPTYIHVRFGTDAMGKACLPEDLHWPPNYCRADGVNPPGQPFSPS